MQVKVQPLLLTFVFVLVLLSSNSTLADELIVEGETETETETPKPSGVRGIPDIECNINDQPDKCPNNSVCSNVDGINVCQCLAWPDEIIMKRECKNPCKVNPCDPNDEDRGDCEVDVKSSTGFVCSCHTGWASSNEKRQDCNSQKPYFTINQGWRNVTRDRNLPSDENSRYFYSDDAVDHVLSFTPERRVNSTDELDSVHVNFSYYLNYKTNESERELPIDIRFEYGFHKAILRPSESQLKIQNEWTNFSAAFIFKEEINKESIKDLLKFVVSAREEANAFIAIRDFTLHYIFKKNDGQSYVVEKNCRKRKECEENYVSDFSWSQFGDLPEDSEDYLTPNCSSRESTLSLKFHHMVGMDAVIKFDYRISSREDFVSIESSYGYTLTTLYRTTEKSGSISWFQGEFRLSDLYPPNSGVMNILKESLSVNFRFFFKESNKGERTESLPERPSSVAIQLKEQAVRFDQLKSEHSSPDIGDNLIPALSSANAKWPQSQVPSQRIEVINIKDGTGKVIQLSLSEADKFELSAKETTTTDGSSDFRAPSYVTFSDWINFVPFGQKYFVRVTSNFTDNTEPVGNWKINAILKLSLIQVFHDPDEVGVDAFGAEIFFEKTFNMTITPGSPLNLTIHDVTQASKMDEETWARMHVTVTNLTIDKGESTTDAAIGPIFLTIEDFAFGDPCFPENICIRRSEKNKCIPAKVDMPKCNCTNEWRGVTCELPDYCNLVHNGTNGSSHCGKISRECKSHDFIPKDRNHLPFHCICNGTDEYWNSEEKNCLTIGKCATVSFCPSNHTCVEERFNSRTPCPVCSPGYKLTPHDSDICIPVDPCESGKSNLELATCHSYWSKENHRLEPVTFCPQGYKYNEESGKCDKIDMKSDVCPEIFRRSLGCQHSCQIEHMNAKNKDASASLSVKCTCFEGWAVVDKVRCEHESWFDDQKCENLCGQHAICYRGDSKYQCACEPGYEFATGSTKDCVKSNYCERNDIADEIELYCGKGVTSCTESNSNDSKPLGDVTCNCPDKYQYNKLTLGPSKLFGCQYKDDLCATLSPEGRKKGQICQLIKKKGVKDETNSLEPIWSCPLGQGVDPLVDACVDLCSIKSNILKCLPRICKVDILKNKTDCDCRPGFITMNNSCLLSTAVYKSGNLTLRLAVDSIDKYPTEETREVSGEEVEEEQVKSSQSEKTKKDVEQFCNKDTDPRNCISLLSQKNVQYESNLQVVQAKFEEKLSQKITDAFAQLFADELPGFQNAIIFNTPQVNLTTSEFLNVQVALIFGLSESNLLPNLTDVQEQIRSLCSKKHSADGLFCVLPSGLSISIANLTSNDLEELNPCEEPSINYCPAGTECKVLPSLALANGHHGHLNGFSYNCQCARGFRIENSFDLAFAYIDSEAKKSSLVPRMEFCVDVDECTEWTDPCPVNSTCSNLVGDYICHPNVGFKWSNDSNRNECISVCTNVTCYNLGSCETSSLNGNDFECKCQDGWKGKLCEMEDAKVKQLRAALISSVTTLSVLLFIAVFAGCISYRRAKSRLSDASGLGKSLERSPSYFYNDKRPHVDTRF